MELLVLGVIITENIYCIRSLRALCVIQLSQYIYNHTLSISHEFLLNVNIYLRFYCLTFT